MNKTIKKEKNNKKNEKIYLKNLILNNFNKVKIFRNKDYLDHLHLIKKKLNFKEKTKIIKTILKIIYKKKFQIILMKNDNNIH